MGHSDISTTMNIYVEAAEYIADFKKFNKFCGISDNFAEFEDCYELIKEFYSIFLSTL